MLLIAGKLDFFMSANSLQTFDAVTNNVPLVAVAAMFQKDPQVFLSHPEAKVSKIEDLKPLTLLVSKEGIVTYFSGMKSRYGFSESKVKPYTFNAQPFIVNKDVAMEGYVSSEPYAVEKAAALKPNVLLIADYGFNAYSTLIETRRDLVDKKPDLVQRLRRCLDRRLVSLPLRRQFGRQRHDQEAQPRHDRRAAGLLCRRDEGAWHRPIPVTPSRTALAR
jgi:NitT/TauT family transport system substrate-binding protein